MKTGFAAAVAENQILTVRCVASHNRMFYFVVYHNKAPSTYQDRTQEQCQRLVYLDDSDLPQICCILIKSGLMVIHNKSPN